MTLRLTSSSFAGTLRNDVAVGTERLRSMFAAIAAPAPRIGSPAIGVGAAGAAATGAGVAVGVATATGGATGFATPASAGCETAVTGPVAETAAGAAAER